MANKKVAKKTQTKKSVVKAAKSVSKKKASAPLKTAAKLKPKLNAKAAVKLSPKKESKAASKAMAKEVVKTPKILVETNKTVLEKSVDVTPAAPAVVPEKLAKVKRTRKSKLAEERLTQMGQKWAALYRKAQAIKPKPYSMKSSFDPKTPIVHKSLGWGYVLANKNDRLEVLFQDGIRFLISNYKG